MQGNDADQAVITQRQGAVIREYQLNGASKFGAQCGTHPKLHAVGGRHPISTGRQPHLRLAGDHRQGSYSTGWNPPPDIYAGQHEAEKHQQSDYPHNCPRIHEERGDAIPARDCSNFMVSKQLFGAM